MKKTMKPAIVTAVCALFLMMACTMMQNSTAQENATGFEDGAGQVCYIPLDPYES